MNVVPLEQTTLTMAELAELVKQGPVILTRDGQPLLVVKDVSGSDWKSVSLASNPLPVLTPFPVREVRLIAGTPGTRPNGRKPPGIRGTYLAAEEIKRRQDRRL
jgi:hypothetical protein